MVIISKPLFDLKIGPEVHCKDILHKWTDSCMEATIKLSIRYFAIGVLIFYLPLYMLKLIIDYKKMSKNYLQNYVKAFLKSVSYGVSFGFLALGTICLNNKILGRFHYYSLGYLPGFVSGLSIFCETSENRLLNTLIWFSLVIESLLNNGYYFRIIHYSAVKETIIFMFVSSFLMYLITNRAKGKVPTNIWFYIPPRTENQNSEFKLNDYLMEIIKYFGIGYGLNSAKHFLSNVVSLRTNPIQIIYSSIFNNKNFKFGMVFGVYTGLFKGVMYLLENCRKNEKSNSAIAGFIAGLSYYIKPTTSMLTFAAVTILQLLSKQFITEPRIKKLPLTELIYMISNGILLFNRIVAPETCPKYYSNMVKVASRGLIEKIYDTGIQKYILSP